MTWLASPPHTRLAELRSRLRTLPEEHVVDLSRDVHGFATAWPVSWLILSSKWVRRTIVLFLRLCRERSATVYQKANLNSHGFVSLR